MITLEKGTGSELHFWVAGLDKRNGSWGPQTAPQFPWEFGRHGAERALEDRLPEHSASWPENGSSSTCLTSHIYICQKYFSSPLLLVGRVEFDALSTKPKVLLEIVGKPIPDPLREQARFHGGWAFLSIQPLCLMEQMVPIAFGSRTKHSVV